MRRGLSALVSVLVGVGLAAAAQTVVSTSDGLGLRFGAAGALDALLVDGQPLPAAGLAGGFFVSEVDGAGEELIANSRL